MADERNSDPVEPGPAAARRPASRAGGVYIALGLLAGGGIGVAAGQPSLGFLIGMAAGAVAAALLWLRDRRR